MNIPHLLSTYPMVLTECAISERLRRYDGISLHPQLFNTPLIYKSAECSKMTEIYSQYREIARKANLPLILCAPTWRLNKERLKQAGFDEKLIGDAVQYMQGLQKKWQTASSPIAVAGLLGPQNDCYTPSQAPGEHEAAGFHRWQIDILAEHHVDCIVAQTIPAVSEGCGIAQAAAEAGVDVIISFVINRRGKVLDGTALNEAIHYIDNSAARKPTGYMVNCVYPTFIQAEQQPAHLFDRLIGIQANSSSKDHHELDGSELLHQDDLDHWGKNMLRLNSQHNMKILGGCCGTDETYLQYLADHRAK